MEEPFGAPTNGLHGADPGELRNSFGYIQNRSIESMIQSDRIQPRQIGTGTLRGQQAMGDTGVMLDNQNHMLAGRKDKVTNVIVGYAPDDGRPGIWVTREGTSAMTLLGGVEGA